MTRTRVAVERDSLTDDLALVCRRVPPLWDLENYVAVNPFVGFTGEPFDQAARQVNDALSARVLPPVEHYRARLAEGKFDRSDLERASRRLGLNPDTLLSLLNGRAPVPSRESRPFWTFAERHDSAHGTDWAATMRNWVARWCAVYASRGGPLWKDATGGLSLFATWREAAEVDRTPAIAGLKGWNGWVSRLPADPKEALRAVLSRANITPDDRQAYLERLLGTLYGWASYFRRASWKAGTDDFGALSDLVAVLAVADVGVAELARKGSFFTPELPATAVADESTLLALQDAAEDGYARELFGRLHATAAGPSTLRPEVQAVFCIDVRSEPFRRHLEAQGDAIETRGFAGFFGVSVDWRSGGLSSPRCPVLLNPAVTIEEERSSNADVTFDGLKAVQSGPGSAFSFVELFGPFYGLGLAADGLAARRKPGHCEDTAPFRLSADGHGTGLTVEARVAAAAAILKNMGLRKNFARVVLLCGHEGHSANNPHAAGLDCGACGGHGGALNARIAAAILNDPDVREGLGRLGQPVPVDTHFLPAVHDTAIDEVSLLDVDGAPEGHRGEIKRLRRWLETAGEATRAERAPRLGVIASRPNALLRALRIRSRDWSEVRPEWGLARNAAFIAARRARTRRVDLEGRAFLHEYDHRTDPDLSILTLILSAPMVVASWINLQYFASTVDNEHFGAGTKTLHNRVGTVGVVTGNGGDLRVGLPLQSVSGPDGRWYHEPLRLQVVVEAPRSSIEQVLAAQPGVRDLVENGYVRLFSLDPEGNDAGLYVGAGEWEEYGYASDAFSCADS